MPKKEQNAVPSEFDFSEFKLGIRDADWYLVDNEARVRALEEAGENALLDYEGDDDDVEWNLNPEWTDKNAHFRGFIPVLPFFCHTVLGNVPGLGAMLSINRERLPVFFSTPEETRTVCAYLAAMSLSRSLSSPFSQEYPIERLVDCDLEADLYDLFDLLDYADSINSAVDLFGSASDEAKPLSLADRRRLAAHLRKAVELCERGLLIAAEAIEKYLPAKVDEQTPKLVLGKDDHLEVLYEYVSPGLESFMEIAAVTRKNGKVFLTFNTALKPISGQIGTTLDESNFIDDEDRLSLGSRQQLFADLMQRRTLARNRSFADALDEAYEIAHTLEYCDNRRSTLLVSKNLRRFDLELWLEERLRKLAREICSHLVERIASTF